MALTQYCSRKLRVLTDFRRATRRLLSISPDATSSSRLAGEVIPRCCESHRFLTLPSYLSTAHPALGWADLSVYDHATYFDARTDSTRSADWYPVFTTWQRLGADSTVLVSRPLPMAGLALRLTPSGEDLAGSIVAFTDAIPPDGRFQATHPVTARRVPCLHSKR